MEAVAEKVPQTIATQGKIGAKGAKKSSANSSFADFIKELGKTTALKKSAEFANPNFIKVSDTGESTAIKKDEMLSNLLKGKTQEIKTPQITQNPLDEILSRPKATHTKLNAEPEIKQPKEAEAGRFSNRDATLRNLKGTNISFEKSKDSEFNFIKTAEVGVDSAKNNAIPSPSDLQKIGQNAQKNQNSANTPNLAPKDSPKIDSAKIAENTPKDSPKIENDLAKKGDSTPKIADLQNNADLKILNDTPKIAPNNELDSAKNNANLAQNAVDSKDSQNLAMDSKDSQDSNKNAKTTNLNGESSDEIPLKDLAQNLQNSANLSQNAPKNPQDTAQNLAQNQTATNPNAPKDNLADDLGDLPKDAQDLVQKGESTQKAQDLAQNAPKSNLGIANTLKYGAFKAFDALSLLTPSDGKKLSELIKKADELALNLQSVKYTKMAQTPLSANYFASQLQKIEPKNDLPNVDSPNADLKVADSQNPKSVKNPQDSALSQILEQKTETPKEAQKIATNENSATKNDKIATNADNGAKNNNSNSTKQDTPKIIEPKAQEPKIAESTESKTTESKTAESKIAESKMPDSPLKAENSDLKPVSFKVGESKPQKAESIANQSANQSESAQNNATQNLTNADSSAKTEQIGNKIFDARETMRHFAHNLRSEIQNYKPPLSRITLELQPANLGSVEVSIISQGKNIQIQLQANQNTLNLFIQNQSDLRSALAQIGYENVAMSFSNGSQMGFSDNSGKWKYESQRFGANKAGNTFGLNENDEQNEIFEIMITNNYA